MKKEFRQICQYVGEISSAYYIDNYGDIYVEHKTYFVAKKVAETRVKKCIKKIYNVTMKTLKETGREYEILTFSDFSHQLVITNDGKMLKRMGTSLSTTGYPIITLNRCMGDRFSYNIHRIMGHCFLNVELNNKNVVVHHIDHIKTNNVITNLQKLTQEEHSRLHCIFKRSETKKTTSFQR